MKLNSKAYLSLFGAIFISSFVSVFSKLAARYPLFSISFIMYYGIALVILVGYSIAWQLSLEKIPLVKAYMMRGLMPILICAWSYIIFGEQISFNQIIGIIVIVLGIGVGQSDDK